MAALNSIQGLGFVGSTRIVLMVCASRSAVSSRRAVSTKTAPMTSVASRADAWTVSLPFGAFDLSVDIHRDWQATGALPKRCRWAMVLAVPLLIETVTGI